MRRTAAAVGLALLLAGAGCLGGDVVPLVAVHPPSAAASERVVELLGSLRH